MKIGVLFPQTEIGDNPETIKKFAQTVEDMGFDFINVLDHVLGVDQEYYKNWDGPFTFKHMIHEPMVLFGFLAGITKKVELGSRIIILPQRQTVLLAKQAAEVDILCNGRLRLGFGVGWNDIEYQGLGQDFHTRGSRCSDQIRLLRALWTQNVVTFDGPWDKVTAAGINPLPIQRPIPIWLGGDAKPVLKRVGTLANGWMPGSEPNEGSHELLERINTRIQLKEVHNYAIQANRDPSEIKLEGRIAAADTSPNEWSKMAKSWQEIGASYISFNTSKAGYRSIDEHLDAMAKFHKATKSSID